MEAGAPETAPQDQQVHHPNLKTFQGQLNKACRRYTGIRVPNSTPRIWERQIREGWMMVIWTPRYMAMAFPPRHSNNSTLHSTPYIINDNLNLVILMMGMAFLILRMHNIRHPTCQTTHVPLTEKHVRRGQLLKCTKLTSSKQRISIPEAKQK